MISEIRSQADQLGDQIRDWRRWFHAHPELTASEEQTARRVAGILREIGLEPVERVGGMWGVTADLRVGDRPFVALRADMDALPVQEETGCEFASRNGGVMHACGHDAHMAMLLGAAKILAANRERLIRSVRFIFQPHEEHAPGGAPTMIAAGVLRDVEEIFGLHVWTPLKAGQLGTRVGSLMASGDIFDVTIRGKGGHAAMPDQCVDPIVAGADFVQALQTVVSRNVPMHEPAVVSVGQFQAGTTANVIPERARIRGTIRTFNPAIRELTRIRVREMAEAVAATHGARAEFKLLPGYPVLVNHAEATEHLRAAAMAAGLGPEGIVELPPLGVGEDFAYYCEQVPGAFAFLGAGGGEETSYPHHHPKFAIEESVLGLGAGVLAGTVGIAN